MGRVCGTGTSGCWISHNMRCASPQGFNSGDQFLAYLRDTFDVPYAEGARARRG